MRMKNSSHDLMNIKKPGHCSIKLKPEGEMTPAFLPHDLNLVYIPQWASNYCHAIVTVLTTLLRDFDGLSCRKMRVQPSQKASCMPWPIISCNLAAFIICSSLAGFICNLTGFYVIQMQFSWILSKLAAFYAL